MYRVPTIKTGYRGSFYALPNDFLRAIEGIFTNTNTGDALCRIPGICY